MGGKAAPGGKFAAKAAGYARTPNASRGSAATKVAPAFGVRAYSAAFGLIAARLLNKTVASILADAMTADAASSQPRKRGWKAWMLGLACVVAVATIALLANAPKPEPVKVWFVGYTNVYGRKCLVFAGTNGTP